MSRIKKELSYIRKKKQIDTLKREIISLKHKNYDKSFVGRTHTKVKKFFVAQGNEKEAMALAMSI